MASNLHGYVGTMGLGLYQLHFYMAAIALCMFAIPREIRRLHEQQATFVFYGIWGLTFNAACALSLAVVNSEGYAIEQYISYSWVFVVSLIYALYCQGNPKSIYLGRLGFLLATIVLCAITFIEFANPEFRAVAIVSENTEDQLVSGFATRIGGLWINPNQNGHALVFGMFASVAVVPRFLKLPYVMAIGLAVLATVSRSSISMWVLSLVILYLLGDFGKKSLGRMISIFLLVFLSIFAITSGEIPRLMDDIGLDGFLNENMSDRLSENFFKQEDNSTDVRKDVAALALEGFTNRPIMGYGLGTSRGTDLEYGSDVGTHNLFLQIALEQGIVGLFTFVVGLLALILVNRTARGFGLFIIFSFANLFSHTLMNQVYIGLLFVLLIALQSTSLERRNRLKTSEIRDLIPTVTYTKPRKRKRKRRSS